MRITPLYVDLAELDTREEGEEDCWEAAQRSA
jgi:hypothetical protein